MRFKSQISWIVALLCLLSFGAQTRAAAITAHDIVRQTTTDVMTVVEEAKGYAEEDPERYYKAIQDIFEGVVDFRGFARGVMGPYATSERYRSLDDAGRAQLRDQLDRFSVVMRDGMVRTYSKGLLAFSGSRIEISKPSLDEAEKDRVSVEQLIFSDQGESYVVMYQMGRDRDGAWKLRNMIIENINLGEIYRNQFQAAARKEDGNLDAVIDQWSAVEIED